jgi:hypothetical protein
MLANQKNLLEKYSNKMVLRRAKVAQETYGNNGRARFPEYR